MKWANMQRYSMGTAWHRPFNMDGLTMERLNNELAEAMKCQREGDLKGWFRGLRGVYSHTHFKYEDIEKTEMIKLEKEITQSLKEKPFTYSKTEAVQWFTQQESIIETKIIDYERLLLGLLYKWDIINLKKIKHPSMAEEIESDYE